MHVASYVNTQSEYKIITTQMEVHIDTEANLKWAAVM